MAVHHYAFRNQRPQYWRLTSPYADKPVDNARGLFPSRKCECQIHFWSWQELNFIKLAEATPAVVRYEARPERIMLRDGPDWFAYVPSFAVHLGGRSVTVELSHLGRPLGSRKEHVARLARGHYRSQNIGFAEIAHTVVRARTRMHNANLLMRYLSVMPHEGDLIRVHDVLWNGPRSITDVAEQSGVSSGRLLAMVRMGELAVVKPGAVTPATLVSMPGARGKP